MDEEKRKTTETVHGEGGTGSWAQQPKQMSPHLLISSSRPESTETFPRQLRDVISLACPGLTPGHPFKFQ